MRYKHNSSSFEEACNINLDKLFNKYYTLKMRFEKEFIKKKDDVTVSHIVEFYEKHFSKHEITILFTLLEIVHLKHIHGYNDNDNDDVIAYG